MLKFEDKKKIFVIFLICSLIFLSMFFIVNSEKILSFFTGILSVLTPILLGFAIAYLLNPILKLFEFRVFRSVKNKRLVRGLSLLLTYIVALLFVLAFAFLIVPQIIASVSELSANFDKHIDSAVTFVNGLANKIMDWKDGTSIIEAEKIYEFINNFFDFSKSAVEYLVEFLSHYGQRLITGLKNFVLAAFISIYALMSKERLQAQIKRFAVAFMKESKRTEIVKYMNKMHETFGNYFFGILLDALIVGILTFTALSIFRIPYPFLIAAICAVTNIILIF